jgi:hypothetical protein
MIASGFKPVAWVAGVGAAALGCYMLSLQVAAERASLAGLDQRIVAARQQIRSLQTELGTRGRIQQLEAWNDEVLALSAPVSGQFVEGQVSLARFDTRQPPQVADTAANVRMASADSRAPVPAPAAPAPAAVPQPQRAIAVASAVAPPPAQQATVQRTSLVTPATAPAATAVPNRPAAAPPRSPAATAPATRTAPLAAARAPSATERTRLADAGPGQAATRKTPTTAPARPPAATPVRAAPAPTRTASTTTTTATRAAPAPARASAATPPPRPSALLNDRAMRDLRARAERERGTGN